MQQIGSLFDKYKKTLRPPQRSVEKKALEVINQEFQFHLTEANLSYNPKTKTLKLNVPSVVRTEVMRQKSRVLVRLKTVLGEYSPTELL